MSKWLCINTGDNDSHDLTPVYAYTLYPAFIKHSTLCFYVRYKERSEYKSQRHIKNRPNVI